MMPEVSCKFLKTLFSRFGAPRAIISDRGTHFCNDQFTKVMLKYGVTHRLSTAYHPQTSGQVEVSNRGLKRILERTVGENRASWSDKLDDVYTWVLSATAKVQLNELNELRDQAYENSLIYKEKTKRIHDAKIKNRVFNVGDRVGSSSFQPRLKIFLDFPDCEDSRACSIHKSFTSSASVWESRTDNQEKDEKQSQNDKTGLGMEKTVKDKAKSKPESQSSQKVNRKVNWSKSKSTQVNPGAKVKEI
ncbi:reverse transcriptase domain-containing protein [Tanacetum coccineum]|uniref:Reverse transcriptase domain-containing protein n=1 Tax=Tanacetum coccineum TaxID=301880 RepID=A0ABQ5CDT1_9ASTR